MIIFSVDWNHYAVAVCLLADGWFIWFEIKIDQVKNRMRLKISTEK